MHEPWPLVKLGEVARHRTESVQIDDFETYLRCRVQLHARGIVLRDKVPGTEIKTKTQWVAVPDDFLVAEIDAKLGGYGIVPGSLAGAVVSSHYFLFELNQEKIMPRWLDLFCRTESFHGQVAAQGSTNYSAVRPKAVLDYAIPLPPVDQQTEIVSKVESSFEKLDGTKRLAATISEDFDRLLVAMAHRDDLTDEEKTALGWRRARLGDVMRIDLDPVKVDPLLRYKTAGCYSYARGLFHKEPVSGLEYQSPFLYRMKAGQFTYLKLKAFEGSFAFVSDEFAGCCVSNEYPMFTMNPATARAEWLFAHFKSPRTWTGISSSSKGIGARRERVNPTAMLAHEVWLPPMADQNKIAEVLTAKRQYDALNTFEKDAEDLRRSILAKAFRGEL